MPRPGEQPVSELPLVTCMCLTRDRREWLPTAIECFLRQDYEGPTELLIVDSGRESVADLVPADDPRIRLIVVGFTTLNVGGLRNAACEAAAGRIIAHWDDDDYSAPRRLTHQVERLRHMAVTGFHSMKFRDGREWWQYTGSASMACGTSLCYWREWWAQKPFADLQCGQDEQFATYAASRRMLAADGDLGLMYATIHAGNTSPRGVDLPGNSCWKKLPGFEWREAA